MNSFLIPARAQASILQIQLCHEQLAASQHPQMASVGRKGTFPHIAPSVCYPFLLYFLYTSEQDRAEINNIHRLSHLSFPGSGYSTKVLEKSSWQLGGLPPAACKATLPGVVSNVTVYSSEFQRVCFSLFPVTDPLLWWLVLVCFVKKLMDFSSCIAFDYPYPLIHYLQIFFDPPS